jgi:cyclopropane-fatty-acyl-phospholipid synthase
MFWAAQSLMNLAEKGLLPDLFMRQGIRRLLKQRLATLPLKDEEESRRYLDDFIGDMANSPIALLTEKANEQHYEVPAEFFFRVLGSRLKYSSCYWTEETEELDDAELAALRLTCEHADLKDGQDILELGCGWGSLTLWMAQHFPASRITAVSNSQSQRVYIIDQATKLGLVNVDVVTCDMNDFSPERRFDRIVSVEMFEHMRNWPLLFDRIAGWLTPHGRLFLHIFCHRALPYRFDVVDDTDWMSKHFFSGGMMPSASLPALTAANLQLAAEWIWDGSHYEKTANAWLENMDRQRDTILPILEKTYGVQDAPLWWVRWRIFFMACAELFGCRHGGEWQVGHYLFKKHNNQTRATR